jgi:hypothetical protein
VVQAEPAASAPVLAEAAASAPASAALPVLATRAESTITTVVVPGAPAPRAPALSGTAVPNTGPGVGPGVGSGAGLNARPNVTLPAPERSAEPARPARPMGAAPGPAGSNAPGSEANAAVPPTLAPGGQAPAAEPARAPATAAGAEPPAAQPPAPAAAGATPVARGPEAICEGRNPVLYFVCMERECLRGRFQQHADCVKWRAEARREVN